jgi:hyaluronan synthase
MDRNALYHLVKYFMDKKVGAVAAHTNVYNKEKNILTRMQAVRYYVDFRAYKAAEALFGRVTCCPGCCSAYRREYLMEVVDEFEAQRFLGARCDYSDDRSLTNFILAKGHKIYYAPEALAYTIVPETFSIFHKQQLRWNKAWLLETYRASLFMWKFNPIFSISFYIGSILSIATPFIVLRALVWVPLVYGDVPLFYLTGIALMAVIYSLYYYIYTDGKDWIYGVVYATVYAGFLSLQMIWAVFKLRDARWGTR